MSNLGFKSAEVSASPSRRIGFDGRLYLPGVGGLENGGGRMCGGLWRVVV